MVQSGVNKLMSHLEVESYFDAKLVIGADYLVTLFQLLHLKDKYELKEFLKMSKIDLIMQGNPYNASVEHLGRLKKKLILINI